MLQRERGSARFRPESQSYRPKVRDAHTHREKSEL